MNAENIYHAPESELVINSSEEQGQQFFTTSIPKMAILAVCTLNFYSFYWFYKHWVAQQRYANRDCMPILRSIFQIIFVYSLFSTVRNEAEIRQVKTKWSAGLLAIFFIVIQLLQNASDRVPSFITPPILETLFWLLIALGALVPMIVVQKTANILNADPGGLENKHFSPANWAFVVLGVSCWCLVIYAEAMLT